MNSHVRFRCEYSDLISAYSKYQVKHILTVNISKMVKDRANVTLSITYEVVVKKLYCIFFWVNKLTD